MDFNDSPLEAAFRADARAFLVENSAAQEGANTGPDADHEAVVAASRRWQRLLAEAGWGAIMWPEQYGGRGLGPIEQVVWNEELARAGITETTLMGGIAMAGPTIIAYGNDEQKSRFLEPTLRGELMWCQLFSEPSAGSDLAGLRTRAERDGDEWVINGQKVWSTFADHADWGFIIARTDPSLPKRKGLSYFLVDMKTPGIEVRPLRDMSGGVHFNEVFLDDVRIPDANRLGEQGQGWPIARTTLLHERMSIGSASRMFSFDEVLAHMRKNIPAPDQLLRDRLAGLYAWSRSLELLNARVNTKLGRGEDPTAEASVMKLAIAEIFERAADVMMRAEGRAALTGEGEAQHRFYFAPGLRIGGGTDEVQRNIIAEQVLGLPREKDPWADTPFEDLPAGS